LADYLVLQGVPFREAHHIVGALVRQAESQRVQIGDLSDEVLTAAHATLGRKEAREALDPAAAVERRDLVGGPAKSRVLGEIEDARRRWSELSA
jgi:argininosuccinate lyase